MFSLRKKRTYVTVGPGDKAAWQIYVRVGRKDVPLEGGDFTAKGLARKCAHAVAHATEPSELIEKDVLGAIIDRSTFPRSSDPPGRG